MTPEEERFVELFSDLVSLKNLRAYHESVVIELNRRINELQKEFDSMKLDDSSDK